MPSHGKLKQSIKWQLGLTLTSIKKITDLSILAFLFVTTTSFTVVCSLIPCGYSYEDSISYKLLRANMKDYIGVFDPGDEYDHVVEITKSGIVFDFLGSDYRDELDNALSDAALGDFGALVRPAYFTYRAYAADTLRKRPGSGMNGEFFAQNANFRTGRYISTDLFNENDNAGGLYNYYVASISPARSGESPLGDISISSSDGNGGDDDISNVGDSPLSTHSMFAALSILGTYPDSGVIEIELPPVFRLGDKKITVGVGWLLPSGLELPIGGTIDDSADEGAYFLSVILRF